MIMNSKYLTNSLTAAHAQHNLDIKYLISRMGSTLKFTSQNLERSQAILAKADQLPSYYLQRWRPC